MAHDGTIHLRFSLDRRVCLQLGRHMLLFANPSPACSACLGFASVHHAFLSGTEVSPIVST
jgi:hypothetical protein